ncbi:MAG: TIGR02099 family protein [Burkholderiaceae bacterium]|nr:TIGR02099 family protein [Burkholderiaceae bacterium]
MAWLVTVASCLALLAWFALQWAILPHVDRWRPQIEAKTSQALGTPVRIAGIEVESGAFGALLTLRDVALLDAQHRPALQLPHVVASISLRSMLASIVHRELRLAKLQIDGAALDVRRDAAGRLLVAGIVFDDARSDGAADAIDAFLRIREFALRDGSLRWTDEMHGAPPLELSAVDIVLRNSLRSHKLQLDATPPPELGDRFELRGSFTQALLARPGDWRHWSGRLDADAPRIDIGRVARGIELPFELERGAGSAHASFELTDGVLRSVTADLALHDAAARLAKDLEPIEVKALRGRIGATREAGATSVSLRGVTIVDGNGIPWSPGTLDARWTHGADAIPTGGKLDAERIDLGVLARTAQRLPLGAALRRLLAQLEPQGIASDVAIAWQGAIDAPAQYRAAARLDGLSIAAADARNGVGRPGLRNAALQFAATDKGGQATLAIKDGAIELPGVFEEAVVPLIELSAQLDWRIEPRADAPPLIELKVSHGLIANADARGELTASWSSGSTREAQSHLPGILDLDATLASGDATRLARYLPLAMPEGARRYIEQAVRGGRLENVAIRVKGPLEEFPFRAHRSGEFRVAAKVRDLTLDYMPASGATTPDAPPPASAWPPLTQAGGEIVLDRGALEFSASEAQLAGVAISHLKGGISDLFERRVLTVQGQAHGAVADMLRFVATTPIDAWTGGALREATASGQGDLTLAFELPLNAAGRASASGSLQLAGSDVRLRHDLPLLGAVRGRIGFKDQGFTLDKLTAQLFGDEVVIDGGTQADGALRVTAQGAASIEALRGVADPPWLAPLARSLRGQARYKMSFARVKGRPEFELTSDLAGVASSLPAPLAKAAEAPLALHVQLAPAPAAQRDTLRVELGKVVQAQFERDLSAAEPRVLRGGIGIFEPAPMPDRGVAAQVSLKSLDVDAWRSTFGAAPDAARGAGAGTVGSGYAPTRIGLNVESLVVDGRRLSHLTAGISSFEGRWRATLQADQLEGYVEYGEAPADAALGSPSGHVQARLTRLDLPRSEVDNATRLLDRPPENLPSLDIVIDDFTLGARRLGRLEALAVNRPPPASEWELTRLRLSLPEASLDATGRWTKRAEAAGGDPRRRAAFDFKLALADSGAFLDQMGTPGVIRGGKGSLEGQVSWLGSPFTMDYPSMTGKFSLDIAAGQFLQAQPGVARLLGVLSLQSLARRLTLDFRDVFADGFAFDSIAGDVRIDTGIATTDKLAMTGPQATVLMAGSADLARETQDLRIVVVPEINAEAASLALAAINPAVGLGTFLAQVLLRQPMIDAGTREFRVTGTWTEPVVESVPRGAPPAAAAASSPDR